jgi:hypothetical protein
MSQVLIETDGTIAGTILKVDGKDITKNNKVVSISMNANAPYKGSVTGDIYRGGSNVSYSVLDEKGVISQQSIGSDPTEYLKGIGQKIKQSDQVTQYLGSPVEAELAKIIDSIVKHCTDNKLPCPTRDILETRTKASLMDKVADLGIKLEA